MKDIALLAVANLPASLCIGAATYLAVNGLTGWGWFLFVALFVCVTRVRSDDKKGGE